ncbi:MAG: Ppx/GppA phosphatase family protein [Mariprofundaceae bacterium]|nr:Ppx/GppA phosphatase family protein [Mariprofundaceae bacterium]
MEITNLIAEDEWLNRGALIAAIDVGSNAMRLGIAAFDVEAGSPQLIQRYREPVRLGHDAFTSGNLSEQTMDDAVRAFMGFRKILDQHHIEQYRATATSAMRDSKNGHVLVKRIRDETGIKLSLISGEEEAHLVQLSISRRVDLSKQFTLLVDMGGGSVEVTLCDDGEVVSAQSFKIGTVRLLEMLGKGDDFNSLLSEYLEGTRKKLKHQLGRKKPALCVATGGNAGAIGSLAFQMLGTESADRISRKELGCLIKELAGLSFEERIRDLGLRPDRADVILPAAMVFREIMKLARVQTMVMPEASLLDGILIGMMESEDVTMHSRRRNLLAWARSLKKKYHVDQHYAKSVARLALSLFDQMNALHHLGDSERLLLELACRAHEIGMYIRVGGHHRHAAYLISASPLLGLSKEDKSVLAHTVRYQRKAFPSDEHESFMALNKADKQRVWFLSAILRLAIGLNKDRRDRIYHVNVSIDDQNITLNLEGDGDLLLERWASLLVEKYIYNAFDRKLQIALDV